MGGLGNGRRGGRSPPLMIGALIACILVLGFNYWVSSSRNLELQTNVYELEGQVRRSAAERGVVEMKKNQLQEEIQRQKEQMSHMESLYKRQLEGAQNTCSQEKGTLQQNISSSAKTIQDLNGQLNQLSDDLGKLQKELQSCQGNTKTLNDKLSYDMTQCSSQVKALKEMCDERVAAVQKKMEKLGPAPGVQKDNPVGGEVKDARGEITASDVVKAATVVSQTPSDAHPDENEPSELLTNDIIVEKAPVSNGGSLPTKNLSKEQPQSVPPASEVKQDTLLPPGGAEATEEGKTDTSKLGQDNLTEDKDLGLMDAPDDGAHTEVADTGMEDLLEGKADDPVDQKLGDQDEYEGDEQVAGDLEKQQQSKPPGNMDLEQELADYNGDDENEGEFEADKQAALAQI